MNCRPSSERPRPPPDPLQGLRDVRPSPQIGSIGHAAHIAFNVIKPASGVIVQGIPLLGRYIAFGNHFTVYGDQRYRLDRHPVMSKHPITPMDEGDIRVHFSKMSDKSVALIDLVHLEESRQAVSDRFDQCLADGADIVLFDTLNDKHLFDIGQLLHEKSEKGTIFAIGSSGFNMRWRGTGRKTGWSMIRQSFRRSGRLKR